MTGLMMRVRGRPWFLWGVFAIVATAVVLVLRLHRVAMPDGPVLGWQVLTGSILAVGMMWQWRLLWLRHSRQGAAARRQYGVHRWLGVGMVVVFGLHAVRFGHGWTTALAGTFLAVAITGLMNREIIGYRRQWAYLAWLWVHMALASALVPLSVVHVWVALAYQ